MYPRPRAIVIVVFSLSDGRLAALNSVIDSGNRIADLLEFDIDVRLCHEFQLLGLLPRNTESFNPTHRLLPPAPAVLLFPSYVSTGMSFTEARGAFQQVLEQVSGPVGITRTLWVLTEDYDRLRVNVALDNIDERTGQPLDIVVVQRYHYASIDSLPGYQMIRSYRRAGYPKFAGVPLAWSTPGYQFDVYQRRTGSSDGE